MNQKDDLVALQSTPLDVGAAIGGVADRDSGAIAVFLGTTRGEANGQGRQLAALDYEAYGEMAEAQMRWLAEEARRRWPIRRLAMLHRIGIVEVGQPSVLIAVSTPHRSDAFEACRFVIDKLKAEVTIWKKEIWSDQSSTWAKGYDRQP
jgi:molybdopterin synthase catalytic subunit